MESGDFSQLISTFIAETQEFLRSLEANLLALEQATSVDVRLQCVKELFRAAHSIKGSAAMFGFEALSSAAHSLEDAFAALRDRADLANLKPTAISALLVAVDRLQAIADQVVSQDQSADSGISAVSDVAAHLTAIAQLKQQFEAEYGQPAPPTSNLIDQPANQEIIKAIFEYELPAVLDRLETELCQAQPDRLPSAIAAIQTVHYQLSGTATMLQLPEFGAIVDQLDTLIQLPALTVEILQNQGWAIAQTLRNAREQILQGKPPIVDSASAQPDGQDPKADKQEAEEQEPEDAPSIIHAARPPSHTPPPAYQRPTIRVDVEQLTALVNLVGELVINRTNLQIQESQLRSEIKRIRQNTTELNQAGRVLREEYDRLSIAEATSTLVAAGRPTHWYQAPFDALEMDHYTEFHSTAQTVIETTQTLTQSATKVDELALRFESSTEQLRRITDQLRNHVMQLRVVPFSRAVDHLPRALRDLCRLKHKEVNLLLLGRDTRIDESLLDALRDPLVHLVRNAFDHGIESPEERVAMGKPAAGQIEIEARHQGGQTIITVTDDGRGIDPEAIRRQVVEREWVTAEQAQALSVADLYDFLFWSGFSTKEAVTDLSGRGVGLDVVRTNLRQVRGSVKVDSRPGKGTSFILKLPLMLSITDALMVRVDHNTIAVPIDAIEEILQIQASQIHMAGNQPMLLWRDEFIRLVRLQDLLQYHPCQLDCPSPVAMQDYIPILILAADEDVVAIAVERVLGQQEIVVKPLPAPLSKSRGTVGCTILGDGSVVTILDVDDLINQLTPQRGTAIAVEDKPPQTLAPVPLTQPQILIVDDSYTIRHLLSLTLTRARYRVVQAKDGQDALEKLQSGLSCSLIIADIEMPRMDGFELLQALKSDSRFASIPVAMLTSRSGTKHRQMATQLGATTYFTKPYSEPQLLDAIAQLLHN